MAKKKKLLIVDDDRSLVELLAFEFEESGYDVLTAHNGESGEIMAREKKPDLIILDIMLPGMDGYRVCRRLKLGQGTRDIPILMLTAKSRIADIEKGFKTHVDDYLVKPFELDRLHEKIKRLLDER